MPEGPFGFPRVTNIGPFVEEKAEQEFNREISSPVEHTQFLDREVMAIHGVDKENTELIRATLDVEVKQEGTNGVLENIKKEVGEVIGNREVALIRYWIDRVEGVGAIKAVSVEDEFRNMNIATTLKERELEFMEQRGVEVVYTDVVSEGGFRLAEKTGFKPIHRADHLIGEEATLNFSQDLNRGVMFKYL